MAKSGRWLIAGMLAVAALAASASWWFRYSATHRAAQFWGPAAAALIRDAPRVELLTLQLVEAVDPEFAATPSGERTAADDAAPSNRLAQDSLAPAALTEAFEMSDRRWQVASRLDVSSARGLTHLRHALLEDRSFRWPAAAPSPETDWRWGLRFSDADQGTAATVLISADADLAARWEADRSASRVVSCHPIADGLRVVLPEMAKAADAGIR